MSNIDMTVDTRDHGPDLVETHGTDKELVRRWRKQTRRAIIERRRALDRDTREAVRNAIVARLDAHVAELRDHAIVGFYWPIQGEPDLRGFAGELARAGATLALPVVVTKRAPVEFWTWRPRMRMQTGPDGIPHPPERDPVRPSALLVPLVGFDPAGYRLGYGAGYYDRTLAVLDPKPLCVGIGLELGRLTSIHPQPHDIPMDVVVTERTVFDLR